MPRDTCLTSPPALGRPLVWLSGADRRADRMRAESMGSGAGLRDFVKWLMLGRLLSALLFLGGGGGEGRLCLAGRPHSSASQQAPTPPPPSTHSGAETPQLPTWDQVEVCVLQ